MNKKAIDNESKYSENTDEQLIEIIRYGNQPAQDFLLNKYKALVRTRSRAYFLIGADSEDIIQEGMIGLYKAMRDYQADKNMSFRGFAELCINRQMITAIKAATRQKHIPLNSYISLNKPIFTEESDQTYMDMLKEVEITNPEALLIGQEDKNTIESHIGKTLSAFETKVLECYLQGKTYSEISTVTGKSEKSIDNALQRIKRKLEKYLNEKKA